jgi:hypothetical protein
MLNFSNALSGLLVLFAILSSPLFATIIDGAAGKCVVHYSGSSDNIVSVWQSMDQNFNTGILGATGSFSSPNSLNLTDLTLTGITQNNEPHLFSNDNGDCVAVWEYVDSNNVFQVAGAVLPSSGSWSATTQLSTTSGEFAGFGNSKGFIDENRKVLVIWTSSDGTNTRVRGATYDINAQTPTWTTGINISQN